MKQFMAWVTGSKNNIFLWARLKLTLIYVAFIAVILVFFSVGLYISIDRNVRDNIGDKIKEKVIKQIVIDQMDSQLRDEFIFGDILLLLVSGGSAFFLAAKNLRPIQDAMKKQNRFMADASHDLRTPLAIMKTDCEVNLRKSNASIVEFRKLAKSNLEEVNRMTAMVEQMLFLSRNNEAPTQLMEPIAFGEFVTKMVDNFQSLASAKGVALVVSRVAAGNIIGNQLSLERMLSNILKNAIDYTQSGGKIEVAVSKTGNRIKLSVKDTGVGISKEDLPHITEAFYKIDNVRGQESGGSGLGLSIVKEIVKNHRGELVIRSQQGVGTEVEIILPRSV